MKRVIILLFTLFCGTLFAVEEELRQVRTLLERGHFDSVESFCNEQFQQSDLDEIGKTLLAAELVRSYSQQWLLAEPVQRARIVRKIESLESTWLAVPIDSAAPDLALAKITFRLQLAMSHRSLGNLQDALEQLKKCQQELQSIRLRTGSNADAPLTQKILALEYSITMQQGITQKTLALTFPAEAERQFELRRATETLAELAAKNSTEPVIVQCKIEKAICHRLCGELDRGKEILTQLLHGQASLSPTCRLQTEAEWIRLHIAARENITELRRQYAADRADARLVPDFDLARLELLLVNDPARGIRQEVAAAQKLQDTIKQHGPYWERRARQAAQSSGSTEWNSPEMLAARAENHVRENRLAEAVELYEQAAAKAEANDVLRYHRLAISILHNALKHAPAEEKATYRHRLIAALRHLSTQFPEHPEASELHLAAIDLLQRESPEEYLTLLLEHLEVWKESPKAQRVRCEAVLQFERQGKIDEAAKLLPLLEAEPLATLSHAMRRLRAWQLDTEGKTQEAVNLLTTLLGQRRESATLELFAVILTRQLDEKSLEYALRFWIELEQQTPKNTETWWTAREGLIEVLCKLNRVDEARKSFDMLRVQYPEFGGDKSGATRQARLQKLLCVD